MNRIFTFAPRPVMMKTMALVLAVMMVLGVATAMGEQPTGSITINIPSTSGITSEHKFEAYQVFSGNLSADGKTLSDIQWGNGVNGAALLSDMQKEDAYIDAKNAVDVAKVLEGFKDDSVELKAFNAIVAKHIDSTKKVEGNSKDGIKNLPYGYYFVKDITSMPGEGGGSDAISAYILQLIGQQVLNIKADAPSITKKIVETTTTTTTTKPADPEDPDSKETTSTSISTDLVDSNNVAIGDTVNYQINTKVPDMSSFVNYYFYVSDTLSKGLTYTPDSLAVTIGGTKYTLASGDLTVGTKTEDETPISINFSKLYEQFKDDANKQVVTGADIVISYSAILNEDQTDSSAFEVVSLRFINEVNGGNNGYDEVIFDYGYGSMDDGTYRIIHREETNHCFEMYDKTSIANTVDFFNETLAMGSTLGGFNQIWFGKEAFNGLALAAAFTPHFVKREF